MILRSPAWLSWMLPAIGFFAGVWLMATPAVFGYVSGTANASHRIVGPIVAAFWIVSLWEVTRNVRWWTTPFAAWLIIEPVVRDISTAATVNAVGVGALMIALAAATNPGDIKGNYGGGWLAIWRPHDPGSPPPNTQEVALDSNQ